MLPAPNLLLFAASQKLVLFSAYYVFMVCQCKLVRQLLQNKDDGKKEQVPSLKIKGPWQNLLFKF